ncbi:MAG TPA: FtsX-like permease family protein [Conexibacter sp.]|jgi:putative ABC transport system permease protein|nr:FtsX-like permease family protein [Conexibacter sp.]
MLGLSLRGMTTRKLRTALTAFAVVLGVALVSGTYLLTDTIDSTFNQVFQTANKGVDVAVTPKQRFGTEQNATPAPLGSAVLDKVRQAPGVALASGSVFLPGLIYNKQDKPLITTGAPMFISDTTPKRFDPFVYVAGGPPTASDGVALDKFSADKAGYRVGDTVPISGTAAQERFKLTGIAKFGEQSSLGGAAVAIVRPEVAQRLLGLHGEYTTIQVAAQAGTTPTQLAANVRGALAGQPVTVRTGSQQATSDAKNVKDAFGFLRTFLFVFAGISLFVGAFLIVNTFSITVAQRVREFALLRMIGASRRQVLRAVIGEALVLGLVASTIGFLAGFGLAPGLKGLFKLFGADLPSGGITLQARTVIVSILVGTLITLVAAVGPAVRATRVPPIAALQDASSLPRGRSARWRTPIAAAIAAIGIALLCLGLFGSASGGSAAALVGAGAAIVFIGTGLLAFHIVGPLAFGVGRPLELLRGVSGRLARENAMRNPRRTASTSAALMIGVALVAFVTIFAAGLKASIAHQVGVGLKGQMIVESSVFGQPLPLSTTKVVQGVPHVQTVSGIRFGKARIPGKGEATVTGIDPQTIGEVFNLTWQQGSAATLRDLGPRDVVVAKGWAKDHGVTVGQTLALTTPTGAHLTQTVRGIYDDKAGLFANLTVSNALMQPAFNVRGNAFLMASVTPGSDPDAVKKAADSAVKAQFPSLKVLTKQGFVDEQKRQVNQLLLFFYVLLVLTVVISLFGIVNTLMLAIHERTRELGMLRAIGTSRRQVRQLVRYESVITAMIGAVLGVVLGGIFAVLVTIPLKSDGFVISIPVGSLIVLLVCAAIAGVLSAILPARRAAKLDVLQALAYE